MNPRRFFRNLPIQQRLTLLLLTPCVVGLLLAGTVLVWFQHRTFKQTFDSDLAAVTDIVAHNSTAAITFDDKLAAAEILDALRAKKHIVGAALALPDGKLLAHFGKLD